LNVKEKIRTVLLSLLIIAAIPFWLNHITLRNVRAGKKEKDPEVGGE